jgi:hypothetical protein
MDGQGVATLLESLTPGHRQDRADGGMSGSLTPLPIERGQSGFACHMTGDEVAPLTDRVGPGLAVRAGVFDQLLVR